MLSPLPLTRLSKLRELLEILAALRDLREPLASPQGFRDALELLLRLAEFAGIDPGWLARVRQILDDPRTFDLVLAVVRYVEGLFDAEATAAMNDDDLNQLTVVDAQTFADWLPIILQIITLIRQLRGDA